MGLFSSITNVVTNLVQGDIKGAFGGSSGGGISNHDKAYAQVLNEAALKYKAANRAAGMSNLKAGQEGIKQALAYVQSADGQKAIALIEGQLNAGQSSNGTTVEGILKTAVSDVIDKGKTAIGTIIDKGAATVVDKVIKSPTGNTLKETLAGFFSDTGTATLKDWLKKNWYWVLIAFVPFGFIIYLLFRLVFGSKTNNKGKSGGKVRTK